MWCRYEERKKGRKREEKKKKYIRVYISIYFYLRLKQTFNWLFIIYTCVHILYSKASCCISCAFVRATSIAKTRDEFLHRGSRKRIEQAHTHAILTLRNSNNRSLDRILSSTERRIRVHSINENRRVVFSARDKCNSECKRLKIDF